MSQTDFKRLQRLAHPTLLLKINQKYYVGTSITIAPASVGTRNAKKYASILAAPMLPGTLCREKRRQEKERGGPGGGGGRRRYRPGVYGEKQNEMPW